MAAKARNSKGWFKRCVTGVKKSGKVTNAKAVCGAVLKRKKAKAKGKRNPESGAAEMFRKFHGADSKTVTAFREKEHYHGNLAQLGVLVEIKLELLYGTGYETVMEFETGDDVVAVANPKGGRKRKVVGPFGQASKLVSKGSAVVEKPFNQFMGTVGKIGDYLDREIVSFGKKNPDGDLGEKLKTDTGLATRVRGWVRQAKKRLEEHKAELEAKGKDTSDSTTARIESSIEYWESALSSAGRKVNPRSVPGATLLCSNEAGTQLYLIGGDQSVDLAALKITGPAAQKESIALGYITEITYRTRKDFDQFKETDYFHKLSEDSGGPLPILIYDRLNRALKVSGGVYKITKPMLETSPGIED